MVINSTLIGLIIVFFIILMLYFKLSLIKEKTRLHKHFEKFVILSIIPLVSLSLQILFSKTNIPPIYFDYITYIYTMIAPVELFCIALLYNNDKCNLDYVKYMCIIPIIDLLILWTNDFHHLFYKVYSIDFSKLEVGFAYYFTVIYSYSLIILDMLLIIRASIRKSGFLSKSTIMILIGILVPVIGNIISIARIIDANIYLTPLLFSVLTICFWAAIFKYKALNITPIAFKTVINTMSDAFIVISDDGTVVDYNKTFSNIFDGFISSKKEDNLFKVIGNVNEKDAERLKSNIDKCKETGKIVTEEYHIDEENFNKYFEVDIHPVKAFRGKKDYIGTLLLFKDITQHKEDMLELERKQDIIVKQGQLVSIGELAGGVAHDINTPISAIKTGVMMLNNSQNLNDDEKEILVRMDSCATKIINIVNSMRNQIRNLGSDTKTKFKISSVVNDIKIITFHEAKKNNSEVIVDIINDVEIMGDPTKFGQVMTNLVVNGIQAYDKEKGGKVEVEVSSVGEYAVVKVRDYAGGIDESIAPFIFKNILTTKGTVGTGLGLYLAYSVIKGNFNGEITFDTEKNEGTTFYIKVPLAV